MSKASELVNIGLGGAIAIGAMKMADKVASGKKSKKAKSKAKKQKNKDPFADWIG
jgi:hypothetical protein